jgi:glycine/D-amino acid oxidase-like deaminating enzyme
MNRHSSDVIVIGGGNIGSSAAYGLAKHGARVAQLDEGDIALRAARGNFGLVWFQGKGIGMPLYVDWCFEATQRWPGFANELQEITGLDLNYKKNGGFDLCLSEAQAQEAKQEVAILKEQTTNFEYQAEFITRDELQAMVPGMKFGPKVRAASFSPHDGHVNPLMLLRALHTGFQSHGGAYYPGHKVHRISHEGGVFSVRSAKAEFTAPKLVLATGLGLPPLAKQLGMHIPVAPQRGQIMVSERVKPILPYPMGSVRQTAEGSFLFGASYEEVGRDDSATASVMQSLAQRAGDVFPCLADLRIVRCWAALRPLTPDKKPVCQESEKYPGAFAFTSHSGVSLASVYAHKIPSWVLDGQVPQGIEAFHARRFNVQAG